MNTDRNTIDRRAWLQTTGTGLLGALALPFLPQEVQSTPRVAPIHVNTAGPIRMHLNENPFGCSPLVYERFMQFKEEYSQYPGSAFTELRDTAAKRYGTRPEQCVVMNGSIEVLKTAGLLAQRSGKAVVSPQPTYDNLMVFAQYLGADIRYVPLKADMQTDLKAMLAAIDDQVGMVFLCNPGNPTGLHLPHEEVMAFMEQVPKHVLIFMDEAYAELADAADFKSMVPWLDQFPNMIISRTMSKAYGLSGFRIGFALAQEALATQLNQLRTTYVTAVGVRAALAAFEDTAWLEQANQATIAERRRVITFLKDRNIEVMDSQANCVWYKTGMDATAYKKKFEEAGILVGRAFPPHLDWCRISIASPTHMTQFMTTYDRLFG